MRARSSKYPILSIVYYLLLGYAVLNSFVAELPSNVSNDTINEWTFPKAGVILTALDYLRLSVSGDLTELSYDTLLLFVQEK